MLVLATLTPLSHMNQFRCGFCALYAWPVDTSLSLWLTPIPHSLMYLPDHQHPVDLVGSWYIRLGYSFRLFNFWRHIIGSVHIYLPLNSPLPASAVKTDKDHRLQSSDPGLTLCRAIHIVIWNQLLLQYLAAASISASVSGCCFSIWLLLQYLAAASLSGCCFTIWLATASQQWYLELHDISHSSNQWFDMHDSLATTTN